MGRIFSHGLEILQAASLVLARRTDGAASASPTAESRLFAMHSPRIGIHFTESLGHNSLYINQIQKL